MKRRFSILSLYAMSEEDRVKENNKRQLVIALCVFVCFTLLFLAANVLNYLAEREGER